MPLKNVSVLRCWLCLLCNQLQAFNTNQLVEGDHWAFITVQEPPGSSCNCCSTDVTWKRCYCVWTFKPQNYRIWTIKLFFCCNIPRRWMCYHGNSVVQMSHFYAKKLFGSISFFFFLSIRFLWYQWQVYLQYEQWKQIKDTTLEKKKTSSRS